MKLKNIFWGIIVTICCITHSYAKNYKELPVPLPPGTVPAGKFENGKIFIDIEERESLTYQSFEELINETPVHSLFALITTKDNNAKHVYTFYSAAISNENLFGKDFSKNRYTSSHKDFTDPTNRSIIINEICYFTIDRTNKKFEHLGTDYEIWHTNKQSLMKTFFYADQGNPDEQTNLGFLYELGKGVEQNFLKAAELYHQAADQENPRAQTNLGFLYAQGKGVEQDFLKAVDLFKKAADKGNSNAQSNLGLLYELGKGVEQDFLKAANLYQKAADQGNPNAQFNLGLLYELGKGVEQDFLKAANLYQKAADQENPRAQTNLGFLYELGKGVEQDFLKAANLYQKAADQGNPNAQKNLERLNRKRKDREQEDLGDGSSSKKRRIEKE